MLPSVHQMVFIQSYKHDGSLHRTLAKGFVLEASEKQFVVVTNKTWVIESDGRRWFTKEPAVNFFYPDKWFNIITMIRKTGIYYYCNLASPSLYDGEAVKNIDYDLDVKCFPDGRIQILDEDEYEQHSLEMGYSSEIKGIVESQLQVLLKMIEDKEGPFDPQVIEHYYQVYLNSSDRRHN